MSSDTIGSINPTSIEGHQKILKMVDLHSRYVLYIPMRSRSEVLSTIKNVLTAMGVKQQRPVKRLYSENAPGFLKESVRTFITTRRVSHTTTMIYQPHINCITERSSLTITEAARFPLAHSGLPHRE